MVEHPDLENYDSLMTRAIARLDAGDHRGGAALLENALRIRSTPSVWQLLGISWKECGDNAEARQALLKVVELNPGDPRAWVNLGAIELDLKLFVEAAEHYRRAVELAPIRVDLRIWLANAYDRAGNLSDALEHYRQAEALEPNNAEVFFERGLAYRNHRRFAEAARDFRRAYELNPSRGEPLELAHQMAVSPHQVAPEDNIDTGDDHAAAIELLSNAITRNRGNAIMWNNRGWAHWQLGRLDAALSDFEHAVLLQSDYLTARVNHAAVLRSLGRLQECNEAERRIVEIDPNFAPGYYNLAVTLRELEQFEEASGAINRAIEIEANDVDYFILRGSILEQLNRKREALAEFTRAVGMDPNNARAYFMRGNMQFDLERLQTAISDYSSALKIAPGVAEVHLNRGLCYFALGQAVEARSDLEQALRLNPQFGIAHLRLGQMARQEGHADEAAGHFAAARSMGFREKLAE